MTPKEIQTQWTHVPICPYCGEKDYDWWDSLEPKEDGDIWDATCGMCEKEYRISMSVSTDFCTDKIVETTP